MASKANAFIRPGYPFLRGTSGWNLLRRERKCKMAPLQCLASLDARRASTGLNSGKQVLVRPVSPEKISQVVGALTFPYSAIQSDPVPALL